MSEGGANIQVDEDVPLSAQVHLRFPELQAEADGVVRRAGQGSIGVEFTDLVYHGRHRWSRKAPAKQDPERYFLAAIGVVFVILVAYSVPGLLPDWVPYARRPAWSVTQPPAFFSLGSSKPQVYALEGPPTRVAESTWYYGTSRVFFRGESVVGWSVSRDYPLRTGAAQPEKTADKPDSLAVGMTADEVLAAQGPPNELTDEVWRYGSSEVYFKDGKVTGWKSTVEQPLKTKSSEAKKRQTRASTEQEDSDTRPQTRP